MIIVCVLREYQHCMSSSLCGCFLAFFRYLNIYSPTICIKAFVEGKKRDWQTSRKIFAQFLCVHGKNEKNNDEGELVLKNGSVEENFWCTTFDFEDFPSLHLTHLNPKWISFCLNGVLGCGTLIKPLLIN